MASLEKRNDTYRIIFYYGDQKFSRSLKTAKADTAEELRLRLERRLASLSMATSRCPTALIS